MSKKGTTESINLVAHGFTQKYLQKDDEVIISAMEHHSNIVPWQVAFFSWASAIISFAGLIVPRTFDAWIIATILVLLFNKFLYAFISSVPVLYAKKQWAEKLPPYQTGGDMIRKVTFAKTEYNMLPYRFEIDP